MSTGRPLRTRERIIIRMAIGFILLVSLGGGLGLASEGIEGRTALRDGPVGTLTPTDRTCGKESCSWIGTFTSTDGTVTARDVDLRDDTEADRGDAMPAAIDDVRLAENAESAYTADYSWLPPVVKGAVVALVGLAIAVGLMVMLRRRRATTTTV